MLQALLTEKPTGMLFLVVGSGDGLRAIHLFGGLQAGPRLFRVLRTDGLRCFALASVIAATGFSLASYHQCRYPRNSKHVPL